MTTRKLALCLLAAALPFAVARVAAADEKKACVDAYVKAQRLRQDAKLRAAREQLLVCAADTCPATLQHDCVQWTSEVDAALPTVVIEVKGPDGRDAVDVKVTMDGDPLVSKLDGSAVAVDPGVHTFRFQIEGTDPVEQKVVIRVADKNRKLAVDMQGGKGETGSKERGGPAAPGTSGPATGDTTRPVPVLVYVLGGVAIVAGAGFTYFAVKTDSQVGDLEKCKPNCAQTDVDDAKTSQALGYVFGGVTLASLGAAAVVFFTRPEKPTQTALVPDVSPLPGGAFARLRGTF